MSAHKAKSSFIQRLPNLQSDGYVRVTSAGRLEVDGRKLFSSQRMKDAVDALKKIPVATPGK